MRTLAVIVGSLSKNSINKKLALALEKAANGIFTFKMLDISAIPLYNGDIETTVFPPAAQRLKDEVAAADAVLLVTPEYNRSIPGTLKNVLDWGSRPMGANAWSGKPVAIAGSSPGAVGTAVAQSHLRGVVTYLGMRLCAQPELYFSDKPGLLEPDGAINDESTRKYLRNFVKNFADWVDFLSK